MKADLSLGINADLKCFSFVCYTCQIFEQFGTFLGGYMLNVIGAAGCVELGCVGGDASALSK